MSIWDTLHSIITSSSNIIEKGKKYVKSGQKPPKGVTLHKGPRGGMFYFIEDKTVKQAGEEHELIRSKGVTDDRFKEIEEKYKSQGAKSVHFVHKPNIERNTDGKKLYNIYVNWGEKTQKKVADKKTTDKDRYGKKPLARDNLKEFVEGEGGVLSAPAYERTDKGYKEKGSYEIHPSGTFGAKLYYTGPDGERKKVAVAYDRIFGDKSETDVQADKSREKNIGHLKGLVDQITHRGGKRDRDFHIKNLERLDEEKAAKPQKPKPPAKNPIWDVHLALKDLIAARRSKDELASVPETGKDWKQEMQSVLDSYRNRKANIPEITAHEEALQRKRGDTPVKEFLATMMRRHYPDASDEHIEAAARSGMYHHAINKRSEHPLSDAMSHSRIKLEQLNKQPKPVPEPQEPEPQEPEWQEAQYKDPKQAQTVIQALKNQGKVVELLQNDWENKKGHTIRIRYRTPTEAEIAEADAFVERHYKRMQKQKDRKYPRTPTKPPGDQKQKEEPAPPKKEPKFKQVAQRYSADDAETRRKEEEAKGREAIVKEKVTRGRTVYNVMSRPKQGSVTVPVSLPVQEGLRTWMRKITHIVPGDMSLNAGEFVDGIEENGQKRFELSDGLYHGNTGSKNQNPAGERYYRVKDGKLTEIPKSDRFRYLKEMHESGELGETTMGKIITDIQKTNEVKREEQKGSENQWVEITGDSYDKRYDLASQSGIRYNKGKRKWEVQVSPDDLVSERDISEQLEYIRKLGLGVGDRFKPSGKNAYFEQTPAQ